MLKSGTHVKIKSKKTLIKELGEDKKGYPRTYARFNTNGEMDHCFETSAVIDKVHATYKFLTLIFDTEIPGYRYTWTFSPDMLEEI